MGKARIATGVLVVTLVTAAIGYTIASAVLTYQDLGFAADLIDGFRIAYLDDGRIGRAEPTGEMGRHVRIARS